ncbi:hypothetical protein VNO80_06892 [Phaseolus coccineus]|uniref:Helicase C-terminal domain-containing protein n=1 Tax=Phaseolus coccineus TaxID=3886 RepID=A0AAN9NIJ5_PHACN
MYLGVPVACRTRSNKRLVVGSGLIMGRKRSRKVDEHDDEVIYLGENLEGKTGARGKFASGSGASCSSPDAMEKGYIFLGEGEDDPIEVVDLEGGDEAEVGFGCCETKGFQVKEEERGEEGEGCYVAADKVESFGGDEYGAVAEKPVVLLPDSDSSFDNGYDSFWSSTESEDFETSDDDFMVEEDDDGVESDDSSEDDERGGYKMVKERVRKVVSESESIRVWRMKGKWKSRHVEEEKWNGADCASVASSKSEIYEERKKAGVKQDANRVENVNNADPEVFSVQWQTSGLSVPSEDEALEDKEKGGRDLQRVFIQKETGYSTVIKMREKNNKVKANVKETGHKDELHEILRMSPTTKNQCFKFFTECFRSKRDSAKDVSIDLGEKVDVDQGQTRPLGSKETIPLNCNSMMKEKPIEKSESEKELDMLWEEMEMLLQAEKIGFQIDSERCGRRVLSGGGKTSGFDGVLFTETGEGSEAVRLRRIDAESEGGCIVFHAPGTGKTRLTMVFLQTYLQVERTAEEVDWSFNQQQKKDAIRMLKLCSWYKEKSILLISYNLYEKLAGGKSEGDGEKEKKNRKIGKEKKRARSREYVETALGNVLRDYPGLLVLDEGHTPRNKRSCIWKETKASKDVSWEPISAGNQNEEKIKRLKVLMNSFVHVHKGSILQKNLPGLRDCVLILKPECLQQTILESIDCSQNALNFEHMLALVSVHPSLFLNCTLSKKEKSVVDSEQLKRIRLDPYEGIKTKFLPKFVRLCDAVNEKVLVFSQFIDTLCLIKDQLESAFDWSVGTEVLYMHGKLDQTQKQFLIHSFNDANSQAKVLLASRKASSEGINLVGASRVVLVDVVWNPSVERQAICRAYRLGQKRVVYTYHLLAQGTPECAKYCKQSEKDRLSELVFSSRNVENDDELKNVGVKFVDKVLDIMVQHKNLKDIFGECLVQPKDRDFETSGP